MVAIPGLDRSYGLGAPGTDRSKLLANPRLGSFACATNSRERLFGDAAHEVQMQHKRLRSSCAPTYIYIYMHMHSSVPRCPDCMILSVAQELPGGIVRASLELPGGIARMGVRTPGTDRSRWFRTPGRDFSNSREGAVSGYSVVS